MKTALTILYLIICIAIVVIVMLQDSKGQGLAAMYPNPLHRTPGDIDWYLPGIENFSKALALVKSKGLAPEIDGDGDYHYSVNGVVVEHHRRWCGNAQVADCGHGILRDSTSLYMPIPGKRQGVAGTCDVA